MKTSKFIWITLVVIQAIVILFYAVLTAWAYRNFGTGYVELFKGPYPFFQIIMLMLWLSASVYASLRHLRNIGKSEALENYGNTGKPIASLRSRLWASVIDGFVFFPVWGTPYFIENWQISYYFLFFISAYFFFLYDFIFDWRTGQTIGKKILNIQVYQLNGEKATFKNAFLRGTPYNLIALYVACTILISYSQFSEINILQLSYSGISAKLENISPALRTGSILSSAILTVDILCMCFRSDKRAFHDIFGKVIVLQNKTS